MNYRNRWLLLKNKHGLTPKTLDGLYDKLELLFFDGCKRRVDDE